MGTAKRLKRPKTTRRVTSKKSFNFAKLPARFDYTSRPSFKALLAIYLVLIILAGTSAALVAHLNKQPITLSDPFAAGQQQAVSFGLYYPASLPAPYAVDGASVHQPQTGVVTMRISNGLGSSAEGRSMTVSQQPVPAGFLFKTFYDSFTNRETYKTDHGIATIGSIDNGQTTLASMVATNKNKSQTWILISANANVSRDDIKDVLSHLSPQSSDK